MLPHIKKKKKKKTNKKKKNKKKERKKVKRKKYNQDELMRWIHSSDKNIFANIKHISAQGSVEGAFKPTSLDWLHITSGSWFIRIVACWRYLTHSYILRKDPPPLCEHCQCILTVRHILVECNHFARERKDIFGRRDVVESFRFHPTLIVLF